MYTTQSVARTPYDPVLSDHPKIENSRHLLLLLQTTPSFPADEPENYFIQPDKPDWGSRDGPSSSFKTHMRAVHVEVTYNIM
jgi:hypothetical protein